MDVKIKKVIRLLLAVLVIVDTQTRLLSFADRPIIHRDVKSSNILITDTFRAKVADFGFSRAGPSGDAGATHVSTQVKGTAGYLDPEYLTTYQLNVKSDVYSFGILLVELFTGRRPIELRRPSDERVTVRWVTSLGHNSPAVLFFVGVGCFERLSDMDTFELTKNYVQTLSLYFETMQFFRVA